MRKQRPTLRPRMSEISPTKRKKAVRRRRSRSLPAWWHDCDCMDQNGLVVCGHVELQLEMLEAETAVGPSAAVPERCRTDEATASGSNAQNGQVINQWTRPPPVDCAPPLRLALVEKPNSPADGGPRTVTTKR